MEPTLLIGDDIIVEKRPNKVQRGDVVVFVFPPDPTKEFVKRVVGLSGDVIAVKDGTAILNGQPMTDPHAHLEVRPQDRLRPEDRSPLTPRDNFGPVTALRASCL